MQTDEVSFGLSDLSCNVIGFGDHVTLLLLSLAFGTENRRPLTWWRVSPSAFGLPLDSFRTQRVRSTSAPIRSSSDVTFRFHLASVHIYPPDSQAGRAILHVDLFSCK